MTKVVEGTLLESSPNPRLIFLVRNVRGLMMLE